jgi:DNA-3-methyladenine glycosylase
MCAKRKIAIRRLRLAELPVETEALARFLIGKIVVRELPEGRLSGRIVECEGYPPGDPAGHHFRGMTPRNRMLFARQGHCYVYFTYGNHFMLNVSSEPEGIGGGVLIRALEPLEGIAAMEKNRGTKVLQDLTRGPGRLAEALCVDKSLDGVDLCKPGPIWLGELRAAKKENDVAAVKAAVTRVSVRIGITKATEARLRFYEQDNPFVSGPGKLRT